MVVTEETPITMAEVAELVGDSEKGESIKKFIKKFKVIPVERAKKIKKELKALDLIKLKDSYIVKIIDFMPSDASELNKVVIEVSLDSDETAKILDVLKNN